MNAHVAQMYARKMINSESTGSGDLMPAMERLERRYGISRWQLSHLRKGNAKTIETGLFHRLEMAFIHHCKSKAKRMLHDARMAQSTSRKNAADIAAIESQISALVAQLEAAKSEAQG